MTSVGTAAPMLSAERDLGRAGLGTALDDLDYAGHRNFALVRAAEAGGDRERGPHTGCDRKRRDRFECLDGLVARRTLVALGERLRRSLPRR